MNTVFIWWLLTARKKYKVKWDIKLKGAQRKATIWYSFYTMKASAPNSSMKFFI